MISILRRFANSWLGAGIMGVILIAFIITLYEGKSGFGLPGTGDSTAVATVGNFAISDADARRAVQNQFDAIRQQQPTLDMTAFAAGGGVDATLNRLIDERALEAFAKSNGLVASKRLVDGAIASIAAFNGPNGQFDRSTFQAVLDQRKLSEVTVREDFAREKLLGMLLRPVERGASAPAGVVAPYATMMLEARTGQIAIVPTAAFASNTPIPDAELTTFYQRNIAAYTVPERRTIQYATFDRTRFEAQSAPSDAEIAAAYKANAAKYAASEQRAFTQIIIASKTDADALYAKVKGGMAMDAAAKSAGLEALQVPAGDKASFAKLTAPNVADAAFAAPRGGLAPLTQSGLGYHIVKVDAVTGIAARSLDQARGELVTELTRTKTDAALADFVAKLDDESTGGATFDDIVKKYGLPAATTPPVTASGLAPDMANFQLPDVVKPLLRDAFQAETGDEPLTTSTGPGGGYVLYHMDRILPSAAKPLTAIKAQVAADAAIDRARKAAKKVADAIAAATNKGTPFAQALAGAGVALPAPKPAGGRRIDIVQARDKVPPPVLAMFSLAAKHARVLPAEGAAGWYIAYVDSVVPGNAQAAAPLMAGLGQSISRSAGEEYVAQFANAVKAQLGVKRNDAAIATLKRAMTGGR